jgi:UDPglucose 6-dehydrogenase
MTRNISVIGLGKLGASMAASMASRGHRITCVDVIPQVVDLVNQGKAPVQETGLAELIAVHKERIRATLDINEAIKASEFSFVIVPTPSVPQGYFSLEYAARAFKKIGRALALKEEWHTVVLTSTVMPGSTRYGLLPILETYSGKICGKDFGLCYSPEFIALGSVIRDFLNPDFVLLGEHNVRTGEHLEQCYREILCNQAPISRMSLENAELAKISVNAFVTAKITFANLMAEACASLPGGDVDVVTRVLGLDSRIGSKYLTGAMGYGGPCFPRDNRALGWFLECCSVQDVFPATIDRLNRGFVQNLLARYQDLFTPGSRVAVLGLAYKPFSHIVEESQALEICRELAMRQVEVHAFDPLAKHEAHRELGNHIRLADSLEECLHPCQVAIIASPDPAFDRLRAEDFKSANGGMTVIDLWRHLAPQLEDAPEINYQAFGRQSWSDDLVEPLRRHWQEVVAEYLDNDYSGKDHQ